MTEMKSGKIGADGRSAPQEKDRPLEFRVIDKRHFTDIENIPREPIPEEKPRYPSFVEELMARLTETERRFEEKKQTIDAETARMRSRMEADYERKALIEKRNLLLPLLEVLDNLERAIGAAEKGGSLDSLLQGVRMTASLFTSKLQAYGVEAVPVLNLPFDPNTGQAVGIVEVTNPDQDGLVLEEVVRGYRMGEQLVRAAQVRVGRFPGEQNS